MSSNSGGGGGNEGVSQRHRNEPTNQRYSNLIHDSEVFLTKLREFKPQSLGCLEARRKSSSTLIFPNPQQACMGPSKCSRYPHDIKPTPGYWIECHGPGVLGKSAVQAAASGEQHSSTSTAANQQRPLLTSSSETDANVLATGEHGNAETSQRLGAASSGGHSTAGTGAGEQQFRTPPGKVDELKLLVDCSSRSSGSSVSQHMPTTPMAERILTRHDKDVLSNQDEIDEMMRHDVIKRRQSADQLEQGATMDQKQQIDGATTTTTEQQGAAYQVDQTAGSGFARVSDNTCSHSSPDGMDTIPGQSSVSTGGASGNKTIGSSGQGKFTDISSSRNANEMRKRLNKRTMTRDDIDLHKPRRGTPNITITEPSFNQSILISYQPTSRSQQHRFGAMRQSSQAGELKRLESLESSSLAQQTNEPETIKFEVQSCYVTTKIQQQSSLDNTDQFLDGSTMLRRQSSELDDESQMVVDCGSSGGGLDFKPYRQQHRPSVIREDSDQEREIGPGGSTTTSEQREFYCGLSTKSFQKKPYQLAYQHQNTDQFRDGSLELISFEEENYEKHYYGREHWNYFTNDELLGPVMLSLKQEVNNQRDHFHVLLRTVSYTLHGTIPASTICADRYDREAIVKELSEIAKLKPPLMLGQLPSTPDELLKLDHIFIKTELKVGVIYIKAGQAESEESILGNKEESPLFTEFLDLLGDRITLKGFDRYKGGLDTVHNLTGTESVYTMWRNIEIMFHVSTMLPHEENDPQKLQKKRHIGNDIVCVAFIESDDTLFWPGCIKSYFLHTFITVQTSPKPLREGEKRKYSVSCVCRNEVQYAFKPYLVEQDEFFKSDYFREWLLVKIVNGERASYSAPKFARMQDRTRSQLLEDIITNLANHLVTGQIPKPYRRGSWRPLGHTRASSPLEDSMKDYFEDYDQLAKDFCNAFCGPSRSMLCDVVFRVKDKDGTYKLVHGVRAIMAIRSRTFLEMLYGFVPPGTGPSSLQNQTNLRAIEMKALSGESSSGGGSGSGGGGGGGGSGRELEQTKSLLVKRGSVGADSGRKIGEKERRQSMLPNLSKSITQKPNYLTVPNTGGGGGGGGTGGSGGSGTGGMIKNAFNRLVSGNWSGWSGNIKGYKGEPMHIKVDQNKTKVDLSSLAICKEIAKIDAEKLSQREFEIKEFDYETFQQTIEYIHNGQCKLSYETIPGLICAAEHYDLPDLLHACFHHANTHMKLSAAPKMMNALYQNSCFYITAMQLLDSIYDYIDPHGADFFSKPEYYELYESVFTTLLSRKTLQISELKKFQAMDGWARQQVLNKQLQKQQQQQQQQQQHQSLHQQQSSDQEKIETEKEAIDTEKAEVEYRNLMIRLNKEVNIKLDKMSNEELVKVVLPTKVFSNDKIFDIMADESRMEY